ncbi:protein transport protein Sec31A isoform X1 [Chiloscyllium punctatum]|uniref:protein transport protein Sec31A isoform X1 n=2 Tax=Chiloscyllium punctatum TaxID=137246 RepID=UPI003B63A733
MLGGLCTPRKRKWSWVGPICSGCHVGGDVDLKHRRPGRGTGGAGAQLARMKLKEINRTAIQAWSPAQQHPIYLAAGTSAQQLDATFSTNASLEIFELDLADCTLDMKSCGSFSSPHRYHKLIWSPHEIRAGGQSSGVLIAGGENGNIILYNPSEIISGGEDVVIGQNNTHSGPVRALDFNPFQSNLVASGANESEIYIWDLNNFETPMTPGTKSQPPEDISCVAWNRQVQHILASANPSGRAVVWDLRKNEPILKVSDHTNRMHCSGLAWHPDIATQMAVASEDDRMPVIQMWDLRFATSPLRVLENHTRGILAIAWSLADPELLLSCGKDNRMLCWNPNTAEVVYELPTATQWCFDIQWCPRNPAILSAAAFDGHISVYSLMGGNQDAQRQRQVDNISSSFGNLDPFGTGQTLPPLQLPQSIAQPSAVLPLKKPPKWIRRPVGATFAFGGKLVTFQSVKPQPQQQQQQQEAPFQVFVSQVVTESELVNRSNDLQSTIHSGGFVEYCQSKVNAAHTDFEKNVWGFLKVNFEKDHRSKYLELLGYKQQELAEKIAAALQSEGDKIGLPSYKAVGDFEHTAESVEDIPAIEDQLLGEAESEHEEDEGDLDLSESTSEKQNQDETKFNISISGDVDGLITQALLTGNFEGAVDLCLYDNRMADAIILAIAGGQELLAKTQKKYFAKTKSKITRLIDAVVTRDWKEILQSCDLQNWKEALAALLTYARSDEFAALCDFLGTRLENEGDNSLQSQACLCYICAGNVEKLVACWDRAQNGNSPLALQDLIEKVVVLRKAIELTQGTNNNGVGAVLAEKMSQYANLLAAQGSLAAALSYLPTDTDQLAILHLRDRLFLAQGEQAPGQESAAFSHGKHQVPRGHAGSNHSLAPGQLQQQASTQQYYAQVRPAPTVTSWSNQTSTALSSFPTASASNTQGEAPPPGFILQGISNPSGQIQTPASTSAVYNMYSQVGSRQTFPQTYQPQQLPQGAGGSTYYQPHQPTAPPPPSSYPSTYLPSVPSHSLPPSVAPPYAGQPQTAPTAPGSAAAFPPFSGASYQHGGPGAPTPSVGYPPATGPTGTLPASNELPASQRTGDIYSQDQTTSLEGPQNGWNDPPALSRMPKKKTLVPGNFTPPAPITAPIMNPIADHQAPMQHQQPPPLQTSFQTPQQLSNQPAVQSSYQGMVQPSLQPMMPKHSTEEAPGAPTGDIIQPVQPVTTEKIAKKPIPEEHAILKIIFEGLIQRCMTAATDPQTKRKLDDANKRLESLYDKLRDQVLSPAIIGGLHNIARSIETRNYSEGLNIHTHIVSTSNFSEISAFMPVLKVVLTQANKLGV